MTEPEHEVPARPAFVLRVRADSTGAQTGWLDDEPVTPPPGVGIHRALIQAARQRADRTDRGRTIRVAGVTPDGTVFHLAVGPDGRTWEVPPPAEDDDPDAVPDEVSHVAELQEHDGRLVGLVDGEEIPLAAGEDPYEQLLREARSRADTHAAGRTVRVLGRTPDGRVWHIALAADGTQSVVAPVATSVKAPAAPVNAFRPLEAEDEPAPQAAYAVESEDEPEDAPPTQVEPPAVDTPATDELTDDLGRPIPTTTTQAGGHPQFSPLPPAPEEPDEAEDEAATAPEATAEPSRGPSRRRLLLGGAGVVVLAGAATAGFFELRGNSTKATPSPTMTGTPLPDGLRPPAGLPASYLWSVVNLSDVAPRLAVTDTRLVCTVDNDTTGGTQLLALDATTGKSVWKADLPIDAIIANGPTLCPIDGTSSIVLTSQSQIIAYPLGGGEAKTWPLQSDWSTSITPSGVIVTKPDDNGAAHVLHDDRLVRRAIVKGTNAVAVLRDGTLVATDSHGRVWLSDDEKKVPKPKKLQAPPGTVAGTYVAATATQLITAFVPKDRPTTSRLRAFTLPDLEPRMTTEAIDPAVFPNTFLLAPDESWAVGGNSWIDMHTGKSHVITARWSPIAISQYDSWSKSGDNILTANRKGESLGAAKGSSGQVLVPRGGTAKFAYCVGSVGSDTTLYAVPFS
ncbi:hypothetical protein [Flexivirga oryzae]|uniref:Outer membrane protein assembly factor BamB n=1 Tax=Flexivirga oryzae TaxID=1794944 RepID=A0A839N838_9MICO|nr:hypothetical protein [Flexivirga oryzae]MBB2893928.1 outer membrane protein assembly factor BamB [Flexivirga oryzae]